MIRIVIAEEQQMLLGAIGSLLNLEDDMEVVGQVCNRDEAITLVHQLQPDVCIMDIDMPGQYGLEAIKRLKDFECKVIILATFARNGYVKQAIKAGVSGYLLKDSPSEVLARSIRHVMAGELVYEPVLLEEDMDDDAPSELLSASNNQQQNNTLGTVKAYLSTIVDKMKLPTG
jgi:two-component system, NarL family, response regulator DesR